ncbi:MAG: NAD(P)-binding domain-containing protein, partial [Opitutae bacterium]|nr:NAD(P)-binding domain-containing protein [Opitutae bacterium]
MSTKLRVGWIGLGVMGFSMAKNLLHQGIELSVYSRTKEKAIPLLNSGAHWADTPAELTPKVDYLFSMVGYPKDVESIYFDDHGIFSSLEGGKVLIDMTTSSPVLAERIAERAKNFGSFALDAPVSGGDVGAKKG